MDQVLQQLPSKYKALSSIPSNAKTNYWFCTLLVYKIVHYWWYTIGGNVN
jgi:hypothetical protein